MADDEAAKVHSSPAGSSDSARAAPGPASWPGLAERLAALGHRAAVEALCRAVNYLLASEPQAERRLAAHLGRRLAVLGPALVPWGDPAGVRLEVEIVAPGRLQPLAESGLSASAASAPDLRLTLDLGRAMSLLAEGAPLAAATRIEGDAALAGDVGWLVANLRWDVEDDLARWVGDLPAHELTAFGRSLGATVRRGADDAVGLLRRGLAEPGSAVLARASHAAFRAEVSELRDATARLEARLALLERQRRPAC